MATRTRNPVAPCVGLPLALLIAGSIYTALVLGTTWLYQGLSSPLLVAPTGSMMPNIHGGDIVITERLLFRLSGLQRHDVITFQQPDRPYPLLKRIVGLAGDTVEIRDGTLYINGISQTEDFVAEAPKYRFGPLTVPAGHVFVLGDNRNNSYDSHSFGPVPIERVLGRVWRLIPHSSPKPLPR